MSDLLTELQEAHRESPSWRLFGLCHQAAARIAALEAQLAERVKAIHDLICDDVLPAYGISSEVGRNDPELSVAIISALEATPPAPKVTEAKPVRPEIKNEMEILKRLANGDQIAFSEDGDMAFFTEGDRAFVGQVIISMRAKGYLKRAVLDDENYRGSAERDVISDAGLRALTAAQEAGKP